MTSGVRYGGGLPKIDARALDDEELLEVRRALRRARGWLGGAALILAAAGAASVADVPLHPVQVFIACIAIAACVVAVAIGSLAVRTGVAAALAAQAVVVWMASVMPEARPPHPWIIAALQLGTVAVSARLVLLRLRDAWAMERRRSAVLHDLRERNVDRCAGRLRALAQTRTFGDLQRRGEIAAPQTRHEIELLPRSGFILRVDGRPLSRPLLAPVTSVAPAVPHALRVALPADLRAIASPTVQLERRSLTPAEREELAARATSMRRPPWSIYVAVPAVMLTASWQWEHTGAQDSWLGLAAIAAYLFGGAAALHCIQRLRNASRLHDDADLRWLVTVTERDAPQGTAPHLEMLPVSRLAWTEHARPATWRLDT
ncbi:MAG: hypothetical protein ACE37F_32355 [Nannocystaceae bacterium]|nr:hypothetical protein [bacterium]